MKRTIKIQKNKELSNFLQKANAEQEKPTYKKILDIPQGAYHELMINTGPSFHLRPLISDTLGDYFYIGSKERFLEERQEHIDAGHKELCGKWLPTFQRGEVWTMEQKRKFMEFLFLGNTPSPIMLTCSCKREAEHDLIIDGQQRLTAIRDFALDKLPIFNDVYCSEILRREVGVPPYMQNTSDARSVLAGIAIPSIRIERHEGKEHLLRQLYNTFNFAGTQHTEEERA